MAENGIRQSAARISSPQTPSCVSILNFDTCHEKKGPRIEPRLGQTHRRSFCPSESNQSRSPKDIDEQGNDRVQRGCQGKNEEEARQREERKDRQKDEKRSLAHHYDEAASREC
ncbi:hypothetical protein K0M31_014260 [Melipona bicolor]|uniref:Uncharacterized protein n=1 Tax=Melipona bicolor TaxID=60889 RepID=A0AA40G874_9HYME|nr:hypothetical protein K0M31_014260 [Melipona bicolor]